MPVIRTKRKKNKERGQPTPSMSDYPPESKGKDDDQYTHREDGSITGQLVKKLTSKRNDEQ